MGNQFNDGNDVVELVIKDSTSRRIYVRRVNVSNEQDLISMFNSVLRKYGVKFKIKNYVWKDPMPWLKADEDFKF